MSGGLGRGRSRENSMSLVKQSACALSSELKQRCKAGRFAYSSVHDMLRKTNSANRARLFNTVVLPSVFYGSETWALTKKEEKKLAVTQRAMERRMLGLSLLDHVSNDELRRHSGIKDTICEMKRNKFRRARHVARLTRTTDG